MQVGSFLETLRQRVRRNRFKALHAETVEGYVKDLLQKQQENLTSLSGTLRSFFGYCASHRYTRIDFSV